MTTAKNPPAQTPARLSKWNISDNADSTGAAGGPVTVTDRVKTRSMTRKADASLACGASTESGKIEKCKKQSKSNSMSKYAPRDAYDVRLMAQGFLPRHLWSTFRGKMTKRS